MKLYALLVVIVAGSVFGSCVPRADVTTHDTVTAVDRGLPKSTHGDNVLSVLDLDSLPPIEHLEDSMYVGGVMYYDGQRFDLSKHEILGPIVGGLSNRPMARTLADSIRNDSASLIKSYSHAAYVIVTGTWRRGIPILFLGAIFTNEKEGRMYYIYDFGDRQKQPVRCTDLANIDKLNRAITDTLRSSFMFSSEETCEGIVVTYNNGRRATAVYTHEFALGSDEVPVLWTEMKSWTGYTLTAAEVKNRTNLDIIVGTPLKASGVLKKTW